MTSPFIPLQGKGKHTLPFGEGRDGLCYNIFMKKRRGIFRTKHRVKTKQGKKAKLVYAKRNPDGTFADIQSIKRANAHERLHHSKKKVKSGYGWRGDTK